MTEGTLYVVTGPSGVGKGTVLKSLGEKTRLCFSVSATTRKPREGEENGREYYFLTVSEFERRIKNGDFLEYARYVGNYYGTPASAVDESLACGQDVVLEIEVQGALQIKAKRPDAVLIFIAPPSLSELRRRLEGRGSETGEVIDRRLAQAVEELKHVHEFHYVVVNDTVDLASDKMLAIMTANKCLFEKNRDLPVLKGELNA